MTKEVMTQKQLYSELHDKLRGFILSRVQGDESLADDLVQEVFLKMQLHLHQLEDEEKVQAWLFRIARNVVTDHFRKMQRKTDVEMQMQEEEEPETHLTAQLASWLPFALEALPDKYREAIRLTEIEGYSQKELATQLGISYSGAKSRVQRGREMLRQVITDCCEVVSDSYGNVLDYYQKPPEPGSPGPERTSNLERDPPES